MNKDKNIFYTYILPRNIVEIEIINQNDGPEYLLETNNNKLQHEYLNLFDIYRYYENGIYL